MARYRMTAARRAALRKAQIESAKKRKRRRRVASVTGGVVAVTAAAAGGSYANKAVMNRRYRNAYKAKFATPKQLTQGKQYIKYRQFEPYTYDTNGVPRGIRRGYKQIGIWKAKPGRPPYRVLRNRPERDALRRSNYDYKERRRNYLSNRGSILMNAKQRRQEQKRAARRAARRAEKGK